jgi:hypothetical protein
LLFDTQAQVAWWRPEANPEKECLEIEPGQRFLFAEIVCAVEFRLTGRVGSRCGIAGYSFSENAKDTLRNLSDNSAVWINTSHAPVLKMPVRGWSRFGRNFAANWASARKSQKY